VPAIRAAIFDIGGVLTLSPVVRVRRFCEERGLEHRVIGPMLDDPAGAWAQFETSRLDAGGFVAAFERDCSERGLDVDGAALLHAIRGAAFEPREDMIGIVRHLRGRVGLGCITNNFAPAPGRSASQGLPLEELFDVVLESSKLGIRKPDPRIYHHACERLGVEPAEAAFLDDLGSNLKGARALGMTTIRVALDETESAIAALEEALGMALPRG
jgi:putative hydrolase of the HAD superfamily